MRSLRHVIHESSGNLFIRLQAPASANAPKCSEPSSIEKEQRTIFPHVPPNWGTPPDESSRPQSDLPLDPFLAGIWAGAVWPFSLLAAEGNINWSDRRRKRVHASTRGMHLRQTHLANRLHVSDRTRINVPLTGTRPVNGGRIVNPEVYACPWSRVERSPHYSDTHRASGNATRVRAAATVDGSRVRVALFNLGAPSMRWTARATRCSDIQRKSGASWVFSNTWSFSERISYSSDGKLTRGGSRLWG